MHGVNYCGAATLFFSSSCHKNLIWWAATLSAAAVWSPTLGIHTQIITFTRCAALPVPPISLHWPVFNHTHRKWVRLRVCRRRRVFFDGKISRPDKMATKILFRRYLCPQNCFCTQNPIGCFRKQVNWFRSYYLFKDEYISAIMTVPANKTIWKNGYKTQHTRHTHTQNTSLESRRVFAIIFPSIWS